ncbi:hypothetical protein [Micromonospora echinospora]|nr:hypothetical protein [Micromonospora echinospora]
MAQPQRRSASATTASTESAAARMTTEGFGRGLAYDGRHLLVGASLFAEEYADRDHDDGFVDVYSADFTLLGRVVFPRSSIRDIRLLAGDRGLSNHSRKVGGPNGRDHV